MSTPTKTNASHELISAMSAQNTHVTYDGPHRTDDDDFVWIPDAEPMIAHSQEHIAAALDILVEVRKSLSDIRSIVYRDTDDSTYQRVDSILRQIDQKL